MSDKPASEQATVQETTAAEPATIHIEVDFHLDNLPRRIIFDPPLSHEEFLSLGQNPVQCERDEKGVIHMMTPTQDPTGRANAELVRQVGNFAAEHGGTVWGPDAGFRLPNTSERSPDVAYVSPENSKDPVQGFADCPEFIIELMSSSNRPGESQEKMQMWINQGVKLGWLIDPYRQCVWIFRRGRPVDFRNTPFIQGEGPVEGFTLNLAPVWAIYKSILNPKPGSQPPPVKFRK